MERSGNHIALQLHHTSSSHAVGVILFVCLGCNFFLAAICWTLQQSRSSGKRPMGSVEWSVCVCKSGVGEKWEFVLCWLRGDALNWRMRMGTSGRDKPGNRITLPGPSSTFVDQETQNHRVVKIGKGSKMISSKPSRITTFSTKLEHWSSCLLSTSLGSSFKCLINPFTDEIPLVFQPGASLVEFESISFWAKRLTPTLPTGQCCCAISPAFFAIAEAQGTRSSFIWCCQLS